MLIGDIRNYIKELQDQLEILKKKDTEILELFHLLEKARCENKNIFIMGNGGSGSTASHWANDFNKGMNMKLPQYKLFRRYKMICLNDNIPTMLALANDDGYENIFSEQLENFLESGDLVIGISGSGNSTNVIKAFEYVKNNNINCTTYAIVGFNGGKLKEIAHKTLHIKTDNMGIFEDISLIIDHILFDCYKKGSLNK